MHRLRYAIDYDKNIWTYQNSIRGVQILDQIGLFCTIRVGVGIVWSLVTEWWDLKFQSILVIFQYGPTGPVHKK